MWAAPTLNQRQPRVPHPCRQLHRATGWETEDLNVQTLSSTLARVPHSSRTWLEWGVQPSIPAHTEAALSPPQRRHPCPNQQPNPPTPPTEPREKCRAITTDGHRCKNGATYNGHLCWPHAHHRNPVLPDPSHVVVPLLEDHASVQLVLSQVTHGLLTNKLDPERARAIIYACQVTAVTLPRPARLPSPESNPPRPDSLATGDRGLGTKQGTVD